MTSKEPHNKTPTKKSIKQRQIQNKLNQRFGKNKSPTNKRRLKPRKLRSAIHPYSNNGALSDNDILTSKLKHTKSANTNHSLKLKNNTSITASMSSSSLTHSSSASPLKKKKKKHKFTNSPKLQMFDHSSVDSPTNKPNPDDMDQEFNANKFKRRRANMTKSKSLHTKQRSSSLQKSFKNIKNNKNTFNTNSNINDNILFDDQCVSEPDITSKLKIKKDFFKKGTHSYTSNKSISSPSNNSTTSVSMSPRDDVALGLQRVKSGPPISNADPSFDVMDEFVNKISNNVYTKTGHRHSMPSKSASINTNDLLSSNMNSMDDILENMESNDANAPILTKHSSASPQYKYMHRASTSDGLSSIVRTKRGLSATVSSNSPKRHSSLDLNEAFKHSNKNIILDNNTKNNNAFAPNLTPINSALPEQYEEHNLPTFKPLNNNTMSPTSLSDHQQKPIKRTTSSVLGTTKKIINGIFTKSRTNKLGKSAPIDTINDIDDFVGDVDDDSASDLDTDDEMKDNTFQCAVISAHKYNNNDVLYEISITHNNLTWVIYKTFREFNDFNNLLKKEYKNKLNIKLLPSLPPRTTLFSTLTSKIIIDRKDIFNKYLNSLLKIPKLYNISTNKISYLIQSFLHIRGNRNNRFYLNQWKIGDNDLSFDSHHVLELIFSARNMPINNINHGCLLSIKCHEHHSDYYSSHRLLMNTDFVIDNKHPKFYRTLIYNYYPTCNNILKIDLYLDDTCSVLCGSANINLMNLLIKDEGYLYVPIITKDHNNNNNNKLNLIKHRRSLPDLVSSKSKKILRADENPSFAHVPCIIIAAKSFNNSSTSNPKVKQLTGSNTHSAQLKSFQTLPLQSLPRDLRIIQWNDDIELKLKSIISHNIETSEFRQSIKSNKKILIEYNFFSIKNNNKNKHIKNEHIASILLDLWKKCIDGYIKSPSKLQKSIKNTLLLIICKLANRFEFDLSHIKHWQYFNLNGYKALTTFQWERIMKQYYKLFIRTVELSLNIIENNQDNLSTEQDTFVKEIIGLSYIRMSHMQHKLLPLLVSSINRILQMSKAARYEFLVTNYPDEDTKKGFMKRTWQEDYVSLLANNSSSSNNNDPFYLIRTPYFDPLAWKWFAPVNTEQNNKIIINKISHKKYIQNNCEFLIKFICKSVSQYNRNYTIYWSKLSGWSRIQQLLVQSIIWTPLDNPNCLKILNFISSLMNISSMRYLIGAFGAGLIRNTDCMYPQQVQICFKYLHEWISNTESDELGLLPDSFCYNELFDAIRIILDQEDWQIICVLLSFLLHHSRLFNESFRNLIFTKLLLNNKYFLKLFCHWNRLVRKYYYMLILYCILRIGYFNENRRKLSVSNLNNNIINSGHRCFVLFDSLTFLVTKDYLKSKLNNPTNNIVSKSKLILIDTNGNKIQYKSSLVCDEKEDMDHLKSFYCNMNYIPKIENDSSLIELLNLQITQIKSKSFKKSSANINSTDNTQRYRVYIDSAFKQFSNLCLRYKKIQLTKKPNNWKFGEVLIPTIMYCITDKNKHLNKFDKNQKKSHKFVQ